MKDKDKAAQSLAVPRLSVCADAQKVDRAKLAQTEVNEISNAHFYWKQIRTAFQKACITKTFNKIDI